MNETGNETVTDTPVESNQAQGVQTVGNPSDNAATNNQPATDTNWSLDLKAFEGSDIDPAFIDSYSGLAKKYGMNQENATALLKDAAEIMNKMDAESVTRQANDWINQSQNDKEFGGAALAVNLAVAKKALETYGTPELKQFIETTGLGNHPELIRLLHKVGKTLTEDGTVTGQVGNKGIRTFDDAAQKLFG